MHSTQRMHPSVELGEQTRNLHLKGVIVRPQLIKSSRTADEIKALVTAIPTWALLASEMESASELPLMMISDTVTDRKSTAVLRIEPR
jgi:hypothetical protein